MDRFIDWLLITAIVVAVTCLALLVRIAHASEVENSSASFVCTDLGTCTCANLSSCAATSMAWTGLDTYPAACAAGSFVSTLADVPTCTSNASTATALAANPADCAATQFATTIAASGDLTCAAIADADVPNTITIDLAAAATALAANPTDCAANQFANAIAASGNLTCAQLDHGADLTGLTDDDHTQYLLLAGRAGGQSASGGTASGEDLTLNSTTNATFGSVILNSGSRTVGSAAEQVLATNGTLTFDGVVDGVYAYAVTGTWSQTLAGWIGINLVFLLNPTITSASAGAAVTNMGAFAALQAAPAFVAETNNVTGTAGLTVLRALQNAATWTRVGGATGTWPESTTVRVAETVNTGWTVTDRKGMHVINRAGSGTVTNMVGLEVDDQTVGTTAVGAQLELASGTGKQNLKASGTATNEVAGDACFGTAGCTPAVSVDVTKDFATRETALVLANGANNNIAVADKAFVRITGPTLVFNITGTATCQDGQQVILYDTTSLAMTITNNSGSSTCKILTLTGADIATTGPGTVTMIYSPTDTAWIVTALQG